jgi:DnaJ-class molecular chaperone
MNMRDPYSVLGVSKTASAAEIKSAFRKLAKKFHPDSNKGDRNAKDKFAEANRAYEIVGDKDKRVKFDRGEIDAEGNPRFAGFEGFGSGAPFDGFEFRAGAGRAGRNFGPDDIGGAEDLLKEFLGSAFGGAAGRGFSGHPGSGPGAGSRRTHPGSAKLDLQLEAKVSVEDLARGKGRVVMPDGKTLAFTLPAGARDGQTIRLGGQGRKAPGMKAGDALITLRFQLSQKYSVDGSDLRIEQALPLEIAVNGGKLAVETFDGKLSVTIPPWTDSGKVFRLKGKGLPKKGGGQGDLLVAVNIVLPDSGREALARLMREQDPNRG